MLGAAINRFKATGDEVGTTVDELGAAINRLGTSGGKLGTTIDELFSNLLRATPFQNELNLSSHTSEHELNLFSKRT